VTTFTVSLRQPVSGNSRLHWAERARRVRMIRAQVALMATAETAARSRAYAAVESVRLRMMAVPYSERARRFIQRRAQRAAMSSAARALAGSPRLRRPPRPQTGSRGREPSR
jgi:hypothetical protein